MSGVIPFGKYKGATIDDVANLDPQYLEWLSNQAWFADRFGHLMSNTDFRPEDTPEHNAMQVRFLDERLRLRVFRKVSGLSGDIKVRLEEPIFECGTDVLFGVGWESSAWMRPDGYWASDWCWFGVECKPTVGDDFPGVLRQISKQKIRCRQHGVHDLRFVLRVLFVGEYSGRGATRGEFVKFFLNSGIVVLFQNDVDPIDLG